MIFNISLILLYITICTLHIHGQEYRLRKTVIPTKYIIRLNIPDVRAESYSGTEIIIFNTTEENNEILLHSSPDYINITKIFLNGLTKDPCSWSYVDPQTEILTILCNRTTESKKENNLQIYFEAMFSSDDQNGFYKFVDDESDDGDIILVTRSSPTYARRIFPCFDEPTFKAVFTFFVAFSSAYSILGNMPVKTQIITQDLKTCQFFPTPLMSTYSIGFLISKLEPVVEEVEGDFVYNIYTEQRNKEYTSIALTYGLKLVNSAAQWTGIKYGEMGSKHLYVTTEEYLQGEDVNNWGLVVSRVEHLLDEGVKTTTKQKQRIILGQANQIAHQWFGHYVSLNWWSNSWLNEGFDTFFEYYLPDQIDSELGIGNQFILEVLHNALYEDSVHSTRELSSNEETISTPSEISYKFNNLMANKGASIIRMMESIVGKENFRSRMISYLKQVQYNNVDPTILMKSLDLDHLLDAYLYKSGYPLVNVKLGENGKSATVSQEPFFLIKADNSDYTNWNVPITFTTSKEKDFNVKDVNWLNIDSNLTLTIEHGSWIILNKQQMGYYRVNYDDELWTRIMETLKSRDKNDIDVINRAQLIDDILAVASVGKIDYAKAFQLVSYLKREDQYYPWAAALRNMKILINQISDEETSNVLKDTILGWINAAFPDIHNVHSSEHIEILKESLILDWKCFLGDQNCLSESKSKFDKYKESLVFQNYNERDTVLCYAMKTSKKTMDDFSFLMNVYKTSKSRIEKEVILKALGCMSDPEVLENYLKEMVLDKSIIPKEDGLHVFESVSSNICNGTDLALHFLEEYKAKLIKRYTGVFPMSEFIVKMKQKISTRTQFNAIKSLVESVEDFKDESSIRTLIIIENNLKWSDNYTLAIKYALQHPLPGSASEIRSPQFLKISFVVICVWRYLN